MQINNSSDLVSYTLTDEESANGSQLHGLQKAVLQNDRIAIMQDIINLKPDSMDEAGKETYWQREAYLRGQLDMLTYILSRSTAYEETNQLN